MISLLWGFPTKFPNTDVDVQTSGSQTVFQWNTGRSRYSVAKITVGDLYLISRDKNSMAGNSFFFFSF